jgi:aspartate carbamoyltransferase catalytic subunit
MFPDHLTTIRGIAPDTLRNFLRLSKKIKADPASFSTVLKGKTVLQFFVENSTRTRMSFEAATRRLGGASIAFAAATSSLQKGETLLDTVRVIQQYGVDAIVMRHSSGGSPDLVARATGLPVINAGDGSHEHPTQALLDAFTLAEAWGSDLDHSKPFTGRRLLIIGDTLQSRVTRSNIHLFSALGGEVILSGPRTLSIRDLSLFPAVKKVDFPDEVIGEVDAVMALRIQFERGHKSLIPSVEEYRTFWGLTEERVSKMRPSAPILHPGPMNRGVEIDPEVADSARALVLDQVENGVLVRMSVLGALVGGLRA